jgi:phosphate transporter
MLVSSITDGFDPALLSTNMAIRRAISYLDSAVASPVLCYSIIQPLLRNMPPESDFAKALVLGIALPQLMCGCMFCRAMMFCGEAIGDAAPPTLAANAIALVLGIALAANVGGAASPIASPQNIIALQNMQPHVLDGADGHHSCVAARAECHQQQNPNK